VSLTGKINLGVSLVPATASLAGLVDLDARTTQIESPVTIFEGDSS
jgi:hypothetical protein